MNVLLMKRILVGAVGGALASAEADYAAFRTWQTWHDVAVYDWRTATFRWFKGAIIGAVTVAGAGVMLG